MWGSTNRSFIAGRGGESSLREQDCLSYRFQVILTNSTPTGIPESKRLNCRGLVVYRGFSGFTIVNAGARAWSGRRRLSCMRAIRCGLLRHEQAHRMCGQNTLERLSENRGPFLKYYHWEVLWVFDRTGIVFLIEDWYSQGTRKQPKCSSPLDE